MSDQPISNACQVVLSVAPVRVCGKPAAFGYEAMGGGWMILCEGHAEKHQPHALPYSEIIARGGRHRTEAEYAEANRKRRESAS